MAELPTSRRPILEIMPQAASYHPAIQFVDICSGVITDDIRSRLRDGLWREVIPDNHEHNIILGLLRRNEWKPVLPGILVKYPGMVWEHGTLMDPPFVPSLGEGELEDFVNAAERFFSQYRGRRIGVQLSGGLDSSLIIGLLRHFGLAYSLVGLTSTRYEFRTERIIQEELAAQAEGVELLDYERCLPFLRTDSVPAHQHPDLSCINFAGEDAMAEACKRHGIEVLLTGFGGDVLWGSAVPTDPSHCDWRPSSFEDAWLADVVYAPHGVDLVPFYSDPDMVSAVYNMRRGQGEDLLKIRTREAFRSFLPRHLAEYTYCADFWGLYVDGLCRAAPTLKQIALTAWEHVRNPLLSPEAIAELLGSDLLQINKKLYQIIEARVSLCIWLNSLHTRGIA